VAHAYHFQDGGERQSGNIISKKKGEKGKRDTMTNPWQWDETKTKRVLEGALSS